MPHATGWRQRQKNGRIVATLGSAPARRLLYILHAEVYRDQLLPQWAASGCDARDAAWRAQLTLAADWKFPNFPLDGNDVMALGYEEGPQIGVLLRDIENWWVENDFAPDRPSLLKKLEEAAKKPRG